MIEAKVVFDGDEINCNGFMIDFEQLASGDFYVADGELFNTLESAIKYCLESKID